MPLYEYQCTACGKLTEKRQKFSDPEITECPHCGGKLERTITAPAVQFKGGGWYADGYGSKKPASNSAGEAGSASASDKGESSKPESGKGESGTKSEGSSKADGGSTAAATASTPATSSTPAAASNSTK